MSSITLSTAWLSGGDAEQRLEHLLEEERQTPRLWDEIARLLITEQRVRDASDHAVARALNRAYSPRPVPTLVRLVHGGRPTDDRVHVIDTTITEPDGIAGWYPYVPSWDEARPHARRELLADPHLPVVLALWDGRAWTGARLDDPFTDVPVRGIAEAMARSRRVAARQQVLVMRHLVACGPDATPHDLAAAALLREHAEVPALSWPFEGSVVPSAVVAPEDRRARRRAVAVLRDQPAGWYEVPAPFGDELCDPERVRRICDSSQERATAVADGLVPDPDVCLVREWDGSDWTGPAVAGERTALIDEHTWTRWSVRPLPGSVAPAAPVVSEAPTASEIASADSAAVLAAWKRSYRRGLRTAAGDRLAPRELVRIERRPTGSAEGVDVTRLSVHREPDSIELRIDGTVAAVLVDGLASDPSAPTHPQSADARSAFRWIPALAAEGALDVRAGWTTEINVAEHLDPGELLDAVRLVGPGPLVEGLHHGMPIGETVLACDRELWLDTARVLWLPDEDGGAPVPVRLDDDGPRLWGDGPIAELHIASFGWFDGASSELIEVTPTVVGTVERWGYDLPASVRAWRVGEEGHGVAAVRWVISELDRHLSGFPCGEHLLRLIADGTVGDRFDLVCVESSDPTASFDDVVGETFPVRISVPVDEEDVARSAALGAFARREGIRAGDVWQVDVPARRTQPRLLITLDRDEVGDEDEASRAAAEGEE